jgi:peptidoglycan/xylan/chitin deacetylase (PgdA/CDA1 family)
VNLDWGRLKAVVLESDDWGLCAWCPDEQAWRVLADTPVFRGGAARRYGGSTLERAEDVRALAELLGEFRGGDGFPPVWQANTVMAAPDYARLAPPLFEVEHLPLVELPETRARWSRPGLWDEVRRAEDAGVWRVELHGLHHLPEAAWLAALRRGTADARRAHEQQSPVCAAVDASGEYDPSEPRAVRRRNLTLAVERFGKLTGRSPRSFCPPDYRWDDALEEDAESLGLTTFQGKAEQEGVMLPRVRRALIGYRWPHEQGRRFYLPPRIAFEPSAVDRAVAARVGPEAVVRAARRAWKRGRPAVVSSHRVNYAHLEPERVESGRGALRALLSVLAREGAVFLTDDEVRALHERGWSVRAIGTRGAILRFYGVPGEPACFPAPAGVTGVRLAEGRGPDAAEATLEAGTVSARVNVGEYLLEWSRA